MSIQYRYEITDSGGTLRKQCRKGEHLIDRKYFGRSYTWKVCNLSTGKLVGWVSGKYVGKVSVENGHCEPVA